MSALNKNCHKLNESLHKITKQIYELGMKVINLFDYSNSNVNLKYCFFYEKSNFLYNVINILPPAEDTCDICI